MTHPSIRAKVRLYTPSEGGRSTVTPSGHFGCILEFDNEAFDCRLLLEEVGPLSPGQEAQVPIQFLRPELLEQRLHIGDPFRLRELRAIGEGIVEEIVG